MKLPSLAQLHPPWRTETDLLREKEKQSRGRKSERETGDRRKALDPNWGGAELRVWPPILPRDPLCVAGERLRVP